MNPNGLDNPLYSRPLYGDYLIHGDLGRRPSFAEGRLAGARELFDEPRGLILTYVGRALLAGVKHS